MFNKLQTGPISSGFAKASMGVVLPGGQSGFYNVRIPSTAERDKILNGVNLPVPVKTGPVIYTVKPIGWYSLHPLVPFGVNTGGIPPGPTGPFTPKPIIPNDPIQRRVALPLWFGIPQATTMNKGAPLGTIPSDIPPYLWVKLKQRPGPTNIPGVAVSKDTSV